MPARHARRLITVALLLTAACAYIPYAQAEDILASTIAATVDPLIEAELAATGTPGAAFVFVQDGRIVYQRGYGVSDLASGAKVDPARTVWPIASISKIVTAQAVLQLVDESATSSASRCRRRAIRRSRCATSCPIPAASTRFRAVNSTAPSPRTWRTSSATSSSATGRPEN